MPKEIFNSSTEYFVKKYGALIYDLCQSILTDPDNAQHTFRSILKKIHLRNRFQKFIRYEQGYVLKVTCDLLLKFYQQSRPVLSPSEQLNLDRKEDPVERLNSFSSYFQRLAGEDQLILLLKDKHGIPDQDISMAMEIPEGSLKIRRQQAFRTLEEWLWIGK